MMTARPVDTIQPFTRSSTESLARTEYARMTSQLRSLAPGEWARPTDCPLWDVRAVAGHSLGMMATFTGFRLLFGSSGQPYPVPASLRGTLQLDFMILPLYRVWVIAAALACCAASWWLIERTPLGATLRAATEKASLTQSFGINVPLLLTLAYGAGIGLAAFAGVLAAPILHVNPAMGSNLVIVVFAIVVIGGMGSMFGSIVTALVIGVVEGWTRVLYSEASSTVIFVLMVLVLLLRPRGLFGREGAA